MANRFACPDCDGNREDCPTCDGAGDLPGPACEHGCGRLATSRVWLKTHAQHARVTALCDGCTREAVAAGEILPVQAVSIALTT